ncbi:MAG TPA: hypothetical protein VMU45_14370 [Candidatus Eisenbacteria bacterium]|nr:hypothetical protein [Candidatus Eisenbacteria bacterium]
MKLVGVLLAIVGWLVPVVALNFTQSLGARFAMTIVGLAITLIGILVVLNNAHQKHAIWKL